MFQLQKAMVINMAFKDEEKKKAYHKKYYQENKHKWKLTPEQKEEKRKYMLKYNKKHYEDNRIKRLQKQREWYQNNKPTKEERRAKALLQRYGLTIEDYSKLLDSQFGKCMLCGIHNNELDYPLFVDHRHSDGKIRGLLCSKCNFKVGWVESNLDCLDEILKYLGD